MVWKIFSFFQGPQDTSQEEPAVPEERTFANPLTSQDRRYDHVKALEDAGAITEVQGHFVTRGLNGYVPVGSVDDKSLEFIVKEVASAVRTGQGQAAAKGVHFDGRTVADDAAADVARRLNVPSHDEHFGLRSNDPESSGSRGMRA